MYRYLDRAIGQLTAHERFLLASIRAWVAAAREGHCICAALQHGFRHHGAAGALGGFSCAMAVLDSEAIAPLRFGSLDFARVTDDEARILALFDVARAGSSDRLRRVSANLVDDAAAPRLARAIDVVARAMTDVNTGRPA